jgi:hypothetical protein
VDERTEICSREPYLGIVLQLARENADFANNLNLLPGVHLPEALHHSYVAPPGGVESIAPAIAALKIGIGSDASKIFVRHWHTHALAFNPDHHNENDTGLFLSYWLNILATYSEKIGTAVRIWAVSVARVPLITETEMIALLGNPIGDISSGDKSIPYIFGFYSRF